MIGRWSRVANGMRNCVSIQFLVMFVNGAGFVSHSACVIFVSFCFRAAFGRAFICWRSFGYFFLPYQFVGMLDVIELWSSCGRVVVPVPMQYVSNVIVVHDSCFFVVIEG